MNYWPPFDHRVVLLWHIIYGLERWWQPLWLWSCMHTGRSLLRWVSKNYFLFHTHFFDCQRQYVGIHSVRCKLNYHWFVILVYLVVPFGPLCIGGNPRKIQRMSSLWGGQHQQPAKIALICLAMSWLKQLQSTAERKGQKMGQIQPQHNVLDISYRELQWFQKYCFCFTSKVL